MFFKKMKHKKVQSLFGYIFISPWIIGVIAFFVLPIISSSIYLFNSVKIVPGGVETTFIGLFNINKVFFEDAENVPLIVNTLGSTLFESSLIIVFSLIIALLLHKKFPTQTLIRAVYMLPIILTSGIILSVFKQDLFSQSAIQNSDTTIFQSASVRDALFAFGLSAEIVKFLTDIVNQILEIVWRSGVQILLFYASLKSISPVYYEVSKVEGATGWQTFWSITFPVISPYILLYSVYTIIDSFMYFGNPVMNKVLYYFNHSMYEFSTIFAFFYGMGVLLLTVTIWGSISKLTSKI